MHYSILHPSNSYWESLETTASFMMWELLAKMPLSFLRHLYSDEVAEDLREELNNLCVEDNLGVDVFQFLKALEAVLCVGLQHSMHTNKPSSALDASALE